MFLIFVSNNFFWIKDKLFFDVTGTKKSKFLYFFDNKTVALNNTSVFQATSDGLLPGRRPIIFPLWLIFKIFFDLLTSGSKGMSIAIGWPTYEKFLNLCNFRNFFS